MLAQGWSLLTAALGCQLGPRLCTCVEAPLRFLTASKSLTCDAGLDRGTAEGCGAHTHDEATHDGGAAADGGATWASCMQCQDFIQILH